MKEVCDECIEEDTSCERWGNKRIIYLAQAIAGITKISIEECLKEKNDIIKKLPHSLSRL